MNELKNWYSWVPVVGLVMLLVGWNISGGGSTNKKHFRYEAAKLSFQYAGHWQVSLTDSTKPRLIQLDEPKVEVVIQKFKKPVFGLVFSQDAYNQHTYKDYQKKDFVPHEVGAVKGHVLDFAYSDANPKGSTDAYLGRDFLLEQGDALIVLTFTAPAEYYSNHLREFDEMIGSITINP